MPIVEKPEYNQAERSEFDNRFENIQISNNAEVERNSSVTSLFELSEKGEESLRTEVEKFDGTVRIFIHPYFDLYYYFPPHLQYQLAHSVNRHRTFNGIEKLLSAEDKKVPPILVFEEKDNISETQGMLLDSVNGVKKIYIVPTHEMDPEPLIEEEDSEELDEAALKSRRESNWNVLIEQLKKLGVIRVLIGGAYLTVQPTEDQMDLDRTDRRNYIYSGCVEEAAKRFKKAFEIQYSFFSYPHTRTDMKRAEQGFDPPSFEGIIMDPEDNES
jgi:hypothetical protein